MVPRIGFGCLGLTGLYGAVNRDQALATIQRAIALGASFLDTSDVYGPYTNEQLVGEAIRGRRDSVVLATKFGNVVQADGSRVVDGSARHARQACEASLRRLGVDHIDLYYLHRVDKQIPIEETVGAMAELVESGKVRYIGLSEAAASTIRRAHAIHPITALQSEYSLWERGLEAEILPTLRELGIGLVPFSPLGRGFLSGAVRAEADLGPTDARRTLPRFQSPNLEANLEIVIGLERIARGIGTTPGVLALAWVLAQGEDIVPIPGTRLVEHLEENLRALSIELPWEDLLGLSSAAPVGAAAGERYPPDFLARLDQGDAQVESSKPRGVSSAAGQL
jgi:aryl-alcohol dehydrogenase-like predicted oxidoreductase